MFAYFDVNEGTVLTYAGIEEMLEDVLAYCDYEDILVPDYYRLHNFSEKDIFDCNYILHTIFSHDNVIMCNGESRYIMQTISLKRDDINVDQAMKHIKSSFPVKEKNKLFMINDILFKKASIIETSNYKAEFIIEVTYEEFDLTDNNDAKSIFQKVNREVIINQLLKDL